MNSPPFPLLAGALRNSSVKITLDLFSSVERMSEEDTINLAERLAASICCPSCKGSGKQILLLPDSSISVGPCVICSGEGTIFAAANAFHVKTLALESAVVKRSNELTKRETSVNSALSYLSEMSKSVDDPNILNSLSKISVLLGGPDNLLEQEGTADD